MSYRRYLCIAVAAVLGVANIGASAASEATVPPAAAQPTARPSDVSSIEAIIKADYECISGGVGVPRQWARDYSLFDSRARNWSVYKDEKTGQLAVWAPSATEYSAEADGLFVKEGFTERELAHKIYRFGNVATVLSSYEGKFASTGRVYSRGVNIYQVYYDGKRWWISSVTWDAEHYVNEIPSDLLPAK